MTTLTLRPDQTNREFNAGTPSSTAAPTSAWATRLNEFFGGAGNTIEIVRRDGSVATLDASAMRRILASPDQAGREAIFREIVGPNADYQDFKRLVDDVMVNRPDARATTFRLSAEEARSAGVVDETRTGRARARDYGGGGVTLDERPSTRSRTSAPSAERTYLTNWATRLGIPAREVEAASRYFRDAVAVEGRLPTLAQMRGDLGVLAPSFLTAVDRLRSTEAGATRDLGSSDPFNQFVAESTARSSSGEDYTLAVAGFDRDPTRALSRLRQSDGLMSTTSDHNRCQSCAMLAGAIAGGMDSVRTLCRSLLEHANAGTLHTADRELLQAIIDLPEDGRLRVGDLHALQDLIYRGMGGDEYLGGYNVSTAALGRLGYTGARMMFDHNPAELSPGPDGLVLDALSPLNGETATSALGGMTPREVAFISIAMPASGDAASGRHAVTLMRDGDGYVLYDSGGFTDPPAQRFATPEAALSALAENPPRGCGSTGAFRITRAMSPES